MIVTCYFSQIYSENPEQQIEQKDMKNVQHGKEKSICDFKVADKARVTECGHNVIVIRLVPLKRNLRL